MMERIVAELEKLIGAENCRIIGERNRLFSLPEPISTAKYNALTFCSKTDSEGLKMLMETHASVIICGFEPPLPIEGKTLVIVKNPRLWFIRALKAFFVSEHENNVEIGINAKIDITVKMFGRLKIGNNVTIKAGAVIGGDGFGYERNEQGALEKFPHFGSVIIGDNVDVGSCTCIDRGSLEDTIIGEGTKIDNHVHIAHNVKIGKHCAIIAEAMIGGGAKIGDYTWIAPCACIRDNITIGDHVLVGMGAVVTKNVADNDVVIGVPAKSIKNTNPP